MNNQFAAEKIAEIEQAFPVNTLLYKGLKVWPLIRLSLMWQLLQPKTAYTFRPNQVWPLVRLGRDKKNTGALRRYRGVDMILYSLPNYHADMVEGKYYDRHIDPMMRLSRPDYKSMKLELASPQSKTTVPRFEPTVFVEPPRKFVAQEKNAASLLGGIGNFADFTLAAAHLVPGVRFDEPLFVEQADLAGQYRLFFREIISDLEPRAVAFPWYYNLITMSLIWACRELGVLTVDIQHGQQGPFHGMYSHWTAIPPEGYELVPSIFWNWGKQSKENIERWHPPGNTRQRSIVGGNLWLGGWVSGSGCSLTREETEFGSEIARHSKSILVTLQNLPEPLPEHLLQAMQQSPRDWLWLIRLSPQHRTPQDQIRNWLHSRGLHNFEIEKSTRHRLYALLGQVNHHVTRYSSVAYEALPFGVPTTLLDDEGRRTYSDYIGRGIFAYAETAEELLASINSNWSREELQEPSPFIETDPVLARDALKCIMNEAKPRADETEESGFEDSLKLALAQEAAALLETKKYDSALDSLDRALAEPGHSSGLHFGRALALSGLNRNEEAKAAAQAELAAQPKHQGARDLLARLDRPAAAEPEKITALRDASDANTPDIGSEETPEDLLAQGETRFREGRLAEAEDLFLRILAQQPDHATALNNMACISWNMGRLDEARERLARVLEISPDDREAVLNLGQVLQALRLSGEARNVYSDYLTRHPEECEMREALSSLA